MKTGYRGGKVLLIFAVMLIAGGAASALFVSQEYRRGRNIYQDMGGTYTEDRTEEKQKEDDARAEVRGYEQESDRDSESGVSDDVLPADAPKRLALDWENLLEGYDGMIAWIQLPAVELDYPVMQAEDNDYWLHRAPDGSGLYAGSLFADCCNSPQFDDRNTVIYGHNMRDGSMFARLKDYSDADVLAESPYFWIYTPSGDFLYRIFSVHRAETGGSTYTVRFSSDAEYRTWLEKMIDALEVDTGDDLPSVGDAVVTLSTCTGDRQIRQVVQGYCIYSEEK